MTHPNICIFASGYGTRLHPLTNHTPKPLIQVGTETLAGITPLRKVLEEEGTSPKTPPVPPRTSKNRTEVATTKPAIILQQDNLATDQSNGSTATSPDQSDRGINTY